MGNFGHTIILCFTAPSYSQSDMTATRLRYPKKLNGNKETKTQYARAHSFFKIYPFQNLHPNFQNSKFKPALSFFLYTVFIYNKNEKQPCPIMFACEMKELFKLAFLPLVLR